MGVFDKFKSNKKEPGEITLQGIQSNSAKLDKASNCFLQCFGPEFTGTIEGHIITDIAGASAIAGLMVLRSTGIDLGKHEPGNIILGEEINQKQEPVFRYITAIGYNMGVDQNAGNNKEAIDENKPVFDTIMLTQKLEKPFYEACKKSGIQKLYYPIVAALTAMKLVGAGKDMGLLDAGIGTSIAMFYVVAGSKTIPHHNQ
jgi:hypothetical protein